MVCGEVQSEGAFDEGNARVGCSQSSTSTKKLTSGVTWKARATIALAANKYPEKYSTFSIWIIM